MQGNRKMQVSYNWTLRYPGDSIKFVVIELSETMPVNGGAIVLHGVGHMYDDWENRMSRKHDIARYGA